MRTVITGHTVPQEDTDKKALRLGSVYDHIRLDLGDPSTFPPPHLIPSSGTMSGEIAYHVLTGTHIQDVVTLLLDHFIAEEPLARSLGLGKTECRQSFLDIAQMAVENEASYVAVHEPTGKVVGARLCHILTRPCEPREPTAKRGHRYGPKEEAILAFLDFVLDGVWEVRPSASKLLSFVIVSVDPGFYRRGIAQEMVELCLALGTALGCEYVVTEAVAVASQSLFHKLGFRTLKTVPYADYKVDGAVVFKDLHDGAESAKLMALRLPAASS